MLKNINGQFLNSASNFANVNNNGNANNNTPSNTNNGLRPNASPVENINIIFVQGRMSGEIVHPVNGNT